MRSRHHLPARLRRVRRLGWFLVWAGLVIAVLGLFKLLSTLPGATSDSHEGKSVLAPATSEADPETADAELILAGGALLAGVGGALVVGVDRTAARRAPRPPRPSASPADLPPTGPPSRNGHP